MVILQFGSAVSELASKGNAQIKGEKVVLGDGIGKHIAETSFYIKHGQHGKMDGYPTGRNVANVGSIKHEEVFGSSAGPRRAGGWVCEHHFAVESPRKCRAQAQLRAHLTIASRVPD